MKGGTESGRGDEGGECGQNESASILPLPVNASAALGGNVDGGKTGRNERKDQQRCLDGRETV